MATFYIKRHKNSNYILNRINIDDINRTITIYWIMSIVNFASFLYILSYFVEMMKWFLSPVWPLSIFKALQKGQFFQFHFLKARNMCEK